MILWHSCANRFGTNASQFLVRIEHLSRWLTMLRLKQRDLPKARDFTAALLVAVMATVALAPAATAEASVSWILACMAYVLIITRVSVRGRSGGVIFRSWWRWRDGRYSKRHHGR